MVLKGGFFMNYYRFGIDVLDGQDFITHTITDIGELHVHDFFEISYPIHGNIKHVSVGTEEHFSSDRFLILRPDDAHAFDERNNKNAFHRDVLVSRKLFKECCDFLSPTLHDQILNAPKYAVVPFSPDEFNTIEKSLKYFSTINKSDKTTIDYLSKAIVCNFLMLFNKNINSNTNNTPNSVLVNNILDAIKTPKVLQNGIPALTEELNYSHGHLCRLIKQELGKKLLDILIEARMEHAAIMLKTTNIPLVDIAATLGYESLSHFISIFEKHHSISPYKYRKYSRNEGQTNPSEIEKQDD